MTKSVDVNNLFFSGQQYKPFKKGMVWKADKWIKTGPGEKDFLIMHDEQDMMHLRMYLDGTHKRFKVDEYNVITTGADKNNNPLVGLYWNDDRMEMVKKAVICIMNHDLIEQVLELVDTNCTGEDEEHSGKEYLAASNRPAAVKPTSVDLERAAVAAVTNNPKGNTVGAALIDRLGHPSLRKA